MRQGARRRSPWLRAGPARLAPGGRTWLLLLVAVSSFVFGALAATYVTFPVSVISDGPATPWDSRDTYAIVDDGAFSRFVDDGEMPAARGRADRRRSGAAPSGGGGGDRAFSRNSPSGRGVAGRIELLDGDALQEPVFWYGGRFQFMDVCPEWGCLAVRFGTNGEAERAWPLRPDALEQAANDAAVGEPPPPRELAPGFSFVRDVQPVGMSRYPNGDLLVVWNNSNRTSFPHFFGAARIDGAGYPVWFRRDYGHHWPRIERDGSALVLGRSTGNESISVVIEGASVLDTVTLDCPPGRLGLDSVDVIGGDGRLLDSIDLVGAMLDSPFAPVLIDASAPSGLRRRTPCNPLHANYVDRIVDNDVQDVWGMSSGDLVVSLRNVSAFVILDAESGRVKRLVRGSFRWQHSVQHWKGSRFLLFDNQGNDGAHGPSRLLMVDLADGRETTIFPNDGTPATLRGLFSRVAGKISISPDRRRALVVFTAAGVAVEVRLSDGAALNVFRSLHDVSALEQFPEERAARPAVFRMSGLDYVGAR